MYRPVLFQMIPTPIEEIQVYEVPPLTEEGEAIVVGVPNLNGDHNTERWQEIGWFLTYIYIYI